MCLWQVVKTNDEHETMGTTYKPDIKHKTDLFVKATIEYEQAKKDRDTAEQELVHSRKNIQVAEQRVFTATQSLKQADEHLVATKQRMTVAKHDLEIAEKATVKPKATVKEADKVQSKPSKPKASKLSFKDQVVVFTGFRNEAWEQLIKDAGGRVTTSISGKTTLVVAKDVHDKGAKLKSARDKGITIISKEEFEQRIS
jgi:NAD-dependent DNA ligase